MKPFYILLVISGFVVGMIIREATIKSDEYYAAKAAERELFVQAFKTLSLMEKLQECGYQLKRVDK